MNQFMLSGQQNVVLYVDGLKIGTTTKSLSATGIVNGHWFLYHGDLRSNALMQKDSKIFQFGLVASGFRHFKIVVNISAKQILIFLLAGGSNIFTCMLLSC
jgi:hypothetical protein